MKGVREAVVRTGVGESAGEHGAACEPKVVLTARGRVHLAVAVLVPDAVKGVVACARAEDEHGVATLDVTAYECVAVAVGEIDADAAADRTAAAGRAVDVHSGKRAGVGRAGAVAGHEERGAEVGKAEALEGSAAVVAGAVERDAGLPGAVVSDEIDALDVDLLNAVKVDGVGAAAAVGRGKREVRQVKAGGVAAVAGVADYKGGAVALVIPDAPAGRSASGAAALVGASVDCAVSHGGRDGRVRDVGTHVSRRCARVVLKGDVARAAGRGGGAVV